MRYRIVFEIDGEIVARIGRRQVGDLVRPFPSRDSAQEVLDGIRVHVAQGMPLQRAIARFVPTVNPADLVEARMAQYIEYFQSKVDQHDGHSEGGSIVNLRRYAQPEGEGSVGAFAWWYGRQVTDIGNADVMRWHQWLGQRRKVARHGQDPATVSLIGSKTRKNISDTFRAFLRWLRWLEVIDRVPQFEAIAVRQHLPQILSLDRREAIFQAIPWEQRGGFLAAAWLLMRTKEIRAVELSDFDPDRRTLAVCRAKKGPRLDARVAQTKEYAASHREVYDDELLRWITWRLEQTSAEKQLRGEETALFWNPAARNVRKEWSDDPFRKTWNAACQKVGIRVKLYEGTKHSTATALAEGGLQPQVLQALGGWRDSKSVERYSKPSARAEAVREARRRSKR